MKQLKSNKKEIIPPLVQDIILAKSGEIIRNIPENEVIEEVVKIYGEMYADIGWNAPDGTDQLLMSERLVKNYIMKYFYTLTIAEIRLVCMNGVARFYGDYVSIGPAVVSGWIHKFMASPARERANKSTKAIPVKTELTDEEKQKLVHGGSLKMFEEFKEKKYVYDSGNATYNYLKSKGVINFTKERTDKIYLQAKSELIESKKQSRGSVKDLTMLKDINKIITDLEGGKRKDEILIEAKRKALNIFFGELVETGAELTDII